MARSRAQAAQSVVTIFAGALVGTFALTVLADQPLLARILGLVAVALWFVAALGYVVAVAVPVPAPTGPTEVSTARSLIHTVLDRAGKEVKDIDRRQRRANYTVVAALLVTVLALAGVLLPARTRFVPGVVVLDSKQATTVRTLCGSGDDLVRGDIDMSSLNGSFVVVRVRHCGTQTPDFLRLPRDDVQAIQISGDDSGE